MKNKNKTPQEVVDLLNDKIWGEDAEHEDNFIHYFNYRYYSYYEQIYFNDILIWCSENEEREWIEEDNDYEDLFNFCIKSFNNQICELTKLTKLVNL